MMFNVLHFYFKRNISSQGLYTFDPFAEHTTANYIHILLVEIVNGLILTRT